MARIFTPPDLEFDRTIPKVFVRNCDWSEEQIQGILDILSDKVYDIYLYNDAMNDIQWAEGIRAQCFKEFNCHHYKGRDPVEWLGGFDNEFK